MASYVNNNLINGEYVIYEGKVSVWSLWPRIVIGLILLGVFGLGLLFWLSAAISYLTTELVITNKRIIAKFGFIRRNTIEMAVIKVESIQVHQSILGRLLNYGSIIVSGAGNPKAPIPGVSKPLLFRKAFFEMQETKQGEPLESPRLIAS